MNGDLNAVCLAKGEHRFMLLFDDANRVEAMRTLGRWATSPDLPEFSWYDAAVLSQRIRALPDKESCCGR